ncbi:MAG: hypothetical protein ACI9F2_000736 [Lysobacterales bacterium]|jgi:hypothetical protein
MKRIVMSFIFILALISITTSVVYAETLSQTYTIGATIPAIPGVNVPLDDAVGSLSKATSISQNNTDIIRENVIRNNEEFMLLTMIDK